MRLFLMVFLASCALAVGHSLATAQVTMPAMDVSTGGHARSGLMLVGNSLQGCNWAYGYCKTSCTQNGSSYLYCRSYCYKEKQKCLKSTEQSFPKGG